MFFFFFSRALVQMGRACFFFRAPWALGAEHVFFFAFWALCEKLIFRTTNILTLGAFFLARTGAGHVFFFAHPVLGGPCMFFFRAYVRKINFSHFSFFEVVPGGRACFFFAPICEKLFFRGFWALRKKTCWREK